MPKVRIIQRTCSSCKFKCVARSKMIAHYIAKPAHCKNLLIKKELEKFILVNEQPKARDLKRCEHCNRPSAPDERINSSSPNSINTEAYYGDAESIASLAFNGSVSSNTSNRSDSPEEKEDSSVTFQKMEICGEPNLSKGNNLILNTTSHNDDTFGGNFDEVVPSGTVTFSRAGEFQNDDHLVDTNDARSIAAGDPEYSECDSSDNRLRRFQKPPLKFQK